MGTFIYYTTKEVGDCMHEFKSALRETLRTTVIALIPVVILQIEAGGLDLKLIGVSVTIGLLRGIEKWLHETERTTGLEFKMIK